MLKNIRLGTKLLIVSTLLMIVPLAVVTYVALNKASTAVVKVGDEGLVRGADFVATDLNHAMQQEAIIVTELASNATIVEAMDLVAKEGASSAVPAIAAGKRTLKQYQQSDTALNHQTLGYLVINTKGIATVTTNAGDAGENFASDRFFKEAMAGHVAFGDVVWDRGDGDKYAHVPVAAPVIAGRNSRVVGVFMEELSLQFVQEMVSTAKVGKTGYVFVLDRNGMTIAHPNEDYIMKLNFLKTAGLKTIGDNALSGRQGFMRYNWSGAPQLAGFASVKTTHWGVGLTVPQAEYLAPVTSLRSLALMVAAIALLLTIVILIYFVRSITKPLNEAVAYANVVAAGDFTRRLKVDRRDEIGILTGALDRMVAKLNDIVVQIRDAAEQTATSSEEISSSAESLSVGAQNQASALEETSASVEELTASVDQVSSHAGSQAASVRESSKSVEKVQNSVQQVSKTLNEVSTSSEESMHRAQMGMESVSKAVDAIKSISQSSDQIAGIITVISDIADQTNLLALNASIEAARAGEHGRGFAVVADEVSKLADRSSSSTKEIDDLIKQSSKSVSLGVEIAQAALDSMQAIIAGAQKTNEMVSALANDIERQVEGIHEVSAATDSISEMSQSISTATEEQTVNAKQVAQAIENVSELTQQAASAAEEMSTATDELSSLAQQMQGLVEQFKLNERKPGHELPQPQQEQGDGHDDADVELPRIYPLNGWGAVPSNGNGHHADGYLDQTEWKPTRAELNEPEDVL